MSDRAIALLQVVGAQPGSKAAGGRYRRSLPVRPGARYWSTVLERKHLDRFGIQFWGRGALLAQRLDREFLRRGYTKLTDPGHPDRVTYSKEVPWMSDGQIDSDRVRSTRTEIDAVLESASPSTNQTPVSSAAKNLTGLSFREFMLNSPLACVELELPKRQGGWRDVDL